MLAHLAVENPGVGVVLEAVRGEPVPCPPRLFLEDDLDGGRPEALTATGWSVLAIDWSF